MNEKEFISKIKSLKSSIIVNDSFFDSNKEKFLNCVASEFNKKEFNIESSNVSGFIAFINKFKIPGLAFGVSTVLFVSAGFTVSAALRSMPGDPLYSFKISMENTRAAMTFDEGDNVNLQVEFAGNRIDELSMVLKSDKADKNKLATDLVNKIDTDLSSVPSKVIALNKDKKSLESTAKGFDDKINEYSVKLKDAKNVANSAGMDDLGKDIDLAYIKGNSVSVKTLNIVIQNVDTSSNNNTLQKDIIDRVEKKVDNIKNVIDSTPNTNNVANNDKNGIINQPNITNSEESKNTNIENGGGSTLAEQLQNMKEELQKAKIGLASADMASVINNVDKGLNNTNISTTPLVPAQTIITPTPIANPVNPDNSTNPVNPVDINNDGSVKMQFESGIGYGLNHSNDYQTESLWSSGE